MRLRILFLCVILILIFTTKTSEPFKLRGRIVFTSNYTEDWIENRGEILGLPYVKFKLYYDQGAKRPLEYIGSFETDADGFFKVILDKTGRLIAIIEPDMDTEKGVGWFTKEARVFQRMVLTGDAYGSTLILGPVQIEYPYSSEVVFSLDKLTDEAVKRFGLRNAHVLSAIRRVNNFLEREVGWRLPQVEVNIFEPIEPWTGWRYMAEHIRLAEGDEFSEKQTIHECIHAVNHQLYGLTPESEYFKGAGGEHDLNYETNPKMAWVEAWPHFFIAHIKGREWIRLAQGLSKQDIESQNLWWKGVDLIGTNNSGEVVEGAIASILWDLSDGVNLDDNDGFDGTFRLVWELLAKNKPANFREFWEAAPFGESFRKIAESNGIVYSRGRILGIKDGEVLPSKFRLRVSALSKEELNVVTRLDRIEGAIIQCRSVPEKGIESETEWDREAWQTIGSVDKEGWDKGWIDCDASHLSDGLYQIAIRVKSKKGYDTLQPIELKGSDGRTKRADKEMLDLHYRRGTILRVNLTGNPKK